MHTVSDEYKSIVKGLNIEPVLQGVINNIPFDESKVETGSLVIQLQCMDNIKTQIGTAYVGELSASFIDIEGVIPTELFDKEISVSIGANITQGNPEYVNAGTFTIKQVELTDRGFRIIAYDDMIKFDKKFNLQDIGYEKDGETRRFYTWTPTGWDLGFVTLLYSLVVNICHACGVEFDTPRDEFILLANSELMNYANTSDFLDSLNVKTYRELLLYIAEFTGSCAVINNERKLKLIDYWAREWTADTILPSERFHGGVFSAFLTSFSAVAFDREEGSIVFPQGTKEGMIYEVDRNNIFFRVDHLSFSYHSQIGHASTAVENIYQKLRHMREVPFNITVPITAMYELGDKIQFEGNKLGGLFPRGIRGIITRITMSYPYGTTLQCAGENPALANPRSREEIIFDRYPVYKPHIKHYFNEHVQVKKESEFDPTASYDENTIIAVVEDY